MKNTSKTYVLAKVLVVLALSLGYFSPFSAEAQIYYAPAINYRQNPVSGSIYLLPNRGLPSGSGAYDSRYLTASAPSVSCAPTRLTATVGQSVTWFSSVTGGNGSYLYTWNGTEGLSGNASTLSKMYVTNGEKFATLTITSGNRVVTVSCGSVMVGLPTLQTVTVPGFGASCYATPARVLPGETVTWLAMVSGATASTTYAWDGTDGLSGDRPLISKTYATNGIKSALLTVTNGTNRIVASCTNAVTVGPRTSPTPSPATAVTTTAITGVCVSSEAKVRTEEEVAWNVAVIGGNGTYSYLWSGDEGLVATTASTTKEYREPGTKNASVTVVSGAKSATIVCPTVEVTKGWSGLTASSFFSWINGTVGYLLALLLAIVTGIFFARRKRAKEEEEEKDHV
ncbi:MAG: PKD domain-containing protein [bacterium]|nr:PKD domain-containing protein [bacterium]